MTKLHRLAYLTAGLGVGLIGSSLLLAPDASARGEMQVVRSLHEPTQVIVKTRLLVWTKGARVGSGEPMSAISPKLLEAINAGLQNKLSGTYPFKDTDGKHYHVNFKVTAIDRASVTNPLESDSFLEILQGEAGDASASSIRISDIHPATDTGNLVFGLGQDARVSESEASDPYSGTVSHETLHLLGLDDRYTREKMNGSGYSAFCFDDPGFSGDIMADQRNPFSNPLHLKAYVEEAKKMIQQGKLQETISEITNFEISHLSQKDWVLQALTPEQAEFLKEGKAL